MAVAHECLAASPQLSDHEHTSHTCRLEATVTNLVLDIQRMTYQREKAGTSSAVTSKLRSSGDKAKATAKAKLAEWAMWKALGSRQEPVQISEEQWKDMLAGRAFPWDESATSKSGRLQAGRAAHVLMSDKERAVEQQQVLMVEVARAGRWFECEAQCVQDAMKLLKAACEGRPVGQAVGDVGVIKGKLHYLGNHLAWLTLQRARAHELRREMTV